MDSNGRKVSVKVIGTNGQISIGKQFAGRQVLVEEREPGVWLVRTASVIPDNERWLHAPQAREELRRALRHAADSAPGRSDPEAVAKLGNVKGRKQAKRKRPARPQQ